jgi:hypothetical protein
MVKGEKMSNTIHYTIELPCNFGDTVYILDDNVEIEEAQVTGFLVIPAGIAIETNCKHKVFYVIGANVFLTKADAIGEQCARKISPNIAKARKELFAKWKGDRSEE